MLYTSSLLNMLLLLINHIYISNLIIIFLGKMNSAFVYNAHILMMNSQYLKWNLTFHFRFMIFMQKVLAYTKSIWYIK